MTFRGIRVIIKFINTGGQPCCVEVYKIREYAAAINLENANGIARNPDMLRPLEINIISPIRLIEGGAAIFAADSVNHIIVISGNRFRSPLVKNKLRVWVASYVLFARENIAEEHRPWAIIIVRAALHPHRLFDIAPIITRPMCPTEE